MTEAVFIEVGGVRTFIFGINLLVAVPITLRSVWFASYPSKRLPAKKKQKKIKFKPRIKLNCNI